MEWPESVPHLRERLPSERSVVMISPPYVRAAASSRDASCRRLSHLALLVFFACRQFYTSWDGRLQVAAVHKTLMYTFHPQPAGLQ